jgi:predicted NBD/HSP70 family sugar kinase
LAYVKVGTGIGAGFIIHGDIYRGTAGFAGEIGHLVIDPSSECELRGLRGCLAAFVGAEALERKALDRMQRGPITVTEIADAAAQGDPIACEIVEEAGHYLGIAVANLLNLFNPATVVLGGPITRTGDAILKPIRETIRTHTLWQDVADSRIATSELGPYDIAVGAATQVLKAALHDPSMFPISRPREATPR